MQLRANSRTLAIIAGLFTLMNGHPSWASETKSAESFRPRAPGLEEFRPVVRWMLARAPADWSQLRFSYAYVDRLARNYLFVTRPGLQAWDEIGVSDFGMLDFFDAYRAGNRQFLAKPWTVVILVLDREASEFDVRFCYATPKKGDVELDPVKPGC